MRTISDYVNIVIKNTLELPVENNDEGMIISLKWKELDFDELNYLSKDDWYTRHYVFGTD